MVALFFGWSFGPQDKIQVPAPPQTCDLLCLPTATFDLLSDILSELPFD